MQESKLREIECRAIAKLALLEAKTTSALLARLVEGMDKDVEAMTMKELLGKIAEMRKRGAEEEEAKKKKWKNEQLAELLEKDRDREPEKAWSTVATARGRYWGDTGNGRQIRTSGHGRPACFEKNNEDEEDEDEWYMRERPTTLDKDRVNMEEKATLAKHRAKKEMEEKKVLKKDRIKEAMALEYEMERRRGLEMEMKAVKREPDDE